MSRLFASRWFVPTVATAFAVGAAGTPHAASDLEYRATANGKRAYILKTLSGALAGDSETYDALHIRFTVDGAQADSYAYTGSGLHVRVRVGENAAASGTPHALSANVQIYDVNNVGGGISEFTPLFGCLNARSARANGGINLWTTDLNSYGSAVAQEGFIGAAFMQAKYHAGVLDDATHRGAMGLYVTTKPQGGGGKDDGTVGLTSYPMHAALRIVGYSGPQSVTNGTNALATAGWNYGVHIGGAAFNGAWHGATERSKVGTGVRVEDFLTYGLQIINRHPDNTGHALHIDSTAGAAGFWCVPDAAWPVAVGAAGSNVKSFLGNAALTIGNLSGVGEVAFLEIGANRTGNGAAYIDLGTDGGGTYPDYTVRLHRDAAGANGGTTLTHRGTGDFVLNVNEAGRLLAKVNGTTRLTVDTTGATVAGLTTTDTLRVNVAPVPETPAATHTAAINFNGSAYKVLCLPA